MIPPAHAPAFLAAHGWGDARILPLAGDASFRRYFRIVDGDRRAVLMDAPPPHEDPRPFIAVAEWLNESGLNAPTILARDLAQGLLLIEDFGDVRLRETVDESPDTEDAYYTGVTDLLVHLHARPPMAGLPVHGIEQWLDEVMLFTDWYCPALGLEVDRDAFRAAWAAVLEPVETDGLARVTVLRDYHAENIMLVAGQQGIAHYGLLDFQDALVGHPAYDLASVLEDARRDVNPAVETAMLARYQAATGRDIEAAYWALAAQRNTRILGVFVRLWKRDDKPHYKSFQPRMWGLLERDLAYPALAPVRAWFDANVPAEKRAAVWA
ncbi:aminoglycoside phosphotransferase family protein [Sphingopyxis witflariensis]|uniref:Aminoglycoside phosphotransferase n=1 Tax=Sphingopyxis witflariensis TaxID=173675 RepID=A0A246JW36_9SPHN|nr:phosphotransferase [Sphingopyxis witflariensis]OWQ96762.1 aminoglycoside phosphotransferase [Sphingopyxis witflariensis]